MAKTSFLLPDIFNNLLRYTVYGTITITTILAFDNMGRQFHVLYLTITVGLVLPSKALSGICTPYLMALPSY